MGIGDILESIFGDLPGQARTKDEQAQAYLEQLMQQAGQTDEITGAPIDMTGRGAQLDALRRMQGIASAGGMTAEDRAQLDQINRQVGQQQQSARQAIMQQQGARGALGGGAQLAQQLMSQQAGADRAAQGGLQTAAQAQQRALQAIQQSGGMGSQLQGQDMQASEAKNRIAQFNAGQRQDALNRRLGLGGAKYANITGQAKSLRDRQQRGEEGLGGAIGGAVQIGGRLITGGMI